MLKICKGNIRPCSDYYSHVCGISSYYYLRGRVESKAICLIGNSSVTFSLDCLSSSWKVASLSLSLPLYIYIDYVSVPILMSLWVALSKERPRNKRWAVCAYSYRCTQWRYAIDWLIVTVIVSFTQVFFFLELSLILFFVPPIIFPSLRGRSIGVAYACTKYLTFSVLCFMLIYILPFILFS